MPEMSGLECTKEIRKLFKMEEMPIIGVSAKGLESDKIIAAGYGMND